MRPENPARATASPLTWSDLSGSGLIHPESDGPSAPCEVYGTNVSRETISKVSVAALEEMASRLNRPLEQVYAAVLIGVIVVRIRDGQVTNRSAHCAIGVTADGTRDTLGIWIGTGGEGAKFWLQVLTEIKSRDTNDACIVSWCGTGSRACPRRSRRLDCSRWCRPVCCT